MRDADTIETPFTADLLENQLTTVAECDLRHIQAGILQETAADLGVPSRSLRGNSPVRVNVLRIEQVPVRDEYILKAIEVHIDEYNTPGPFRGIHSC